FCACVMLILERGNEHFDSIPYLSGLGLVVRIQDVLDGAHDFLSTRGGWEQGVRQLSVLKAGEINHDDLYLGIGLGQAAGHFIAFGLRDTIAEHGDIEDLLRNRQVSSFAAERKGNLMPSGA